MLVKSRGAVETRKKCAICKEESGQETYIYECIERGKVFEQEYRVTKMMREERGNRRRRGKRGEKSYQGFQRFS